MTHDKATALREAAERVNSVAQRLGPENIYEALQQYPQATSWGRTDAFAFDLRALLAERERLRAFALAYRRKMEVGIAGMTDEEIQTLRLAWDYASAALKATDDQ